MRTLRSASHLIATLLAVALAPAVAHASGDLQVVGSDGSSWDEIVRHLQHNTNSQGIAILVMVTHGDARLTCNAYRLSPEPAAAEAFEIGACDPATAQTTLVLRSRTALFDHSSSFPMPREVRMTAENLTTQTCSAVLRPTVRNPETGETVVATPRDFTIRPLVDRVMVGERVDAWHVEVAPPIDGLSFRYDVLLRSGALVATVDGLFQCPPGAISADVTTGARVPDSPHGEGSSGHRTVQAGAIIAATFGALGLVGIMALGSASNAPGEAFLGVIAVAVGGAAIGGLIALGGAVQIAAGNSGSRAALTAPPRFAISPTAFPHGGGGAALTVRF